MTRMSVTQHKKIKTLPWEIQSSEQNAALLSLRWSLDIQARSSAAGKGDSAFSKREAEGGRRDGKDQKKWVIS